MKRIHDTFFAELGPQLLYLDDLRAIYDYLKERGFKLTISTKSHKLDSVDEIREVSASPINYLAIQAESNTPTWEIIMIHFRPAYCTIYCGSDDETLLGVCKKVQSLLEKTRRGLLKWIFSITGAFVLLGLNLFLVQGPLRGSTAALPLSLIALAYPIVATYFGFWRQTVIVPRNRAESPTFFDRHGYDLTKSIVLLLLGSVFGIVVQGYLKGSDKAVASPATQPTTRGNE